MIEVSRLPKLSHARPLGHEDVHRTGLVVLLADVPFRQSQVPARHLKTGVPHDPLEGEDVAAVPEEVQGEGVPEVVGADVHAQMLRIVRGHLGAPHPHLHGPPLPRAENRNVLLPFLGPVFQKKPDGVRRHLR